MIDEVDLEEYYQFTGKALAPESLPRKENFIANYEVIRYLTEKDVVVRKRVSGDLYMVTVERVGNNTFKLFSALIGIVSAKRLSEPNPFGRYIKYLDSFRDETNIYIFFEYHESLHGAHRSGST